MILKDALKAASIDMSEEDVFDIARLSDNFTPCDLIVFVRDASYSQLRNFMKAKSFKKVNGKYIGLPNDEGEVKNYLDIKSSEICL